MTAIRKTVSRNLRVLREVRGLTQEVLAETAGVNRTYLSQIENDIYGASIDKLEPIAIALGVEPWELLHPGTAERYRPK